MQSRKKWVMARSYAGVLRGDIQETVGAALADVYYVRIKGMTYIIYQTADLETFVVDAKSGQCAFAFDDKRLDLAGMEEEPAWKILKGHKSDISGALDMLRLEPDYKDRVRMFQWLKKAVTTIDDLFLLEDMAETRKPEEVRKEDAA